MAHASATMRVFASFSTKLNHLASRAYFIQFSIDPFVSDYFTDLTSIETTMINGVSVLDNVQIEMCNVRVKMWYGFWTASAALPRISNALNATQTTNNAVNKTQLIAKYLINLLQSNTSICVYSIQYTHKHTYTRAFKYNNVVLMVNIVDFFHYEEQNNKSIICGGSWLLVNVKLALRPSTCNLQPCLGWIVDSVFFHFIVVFSLRNSNRPYLFSYVKYIFKEGINK